MNPELENILDEMLTSSGIHITASSFSPEEIVVVSSGISTSINYGNGTIYLSPQSTGIYYGIINVTPTTPYYQYDITYTISTPPIEPFKEEQKEVDPTDIFEIF